MCLWKDVWLQWRSPDYNAVRLASSLLLSLATGSAFYGAGRRFDTRQGVIALAGSAYTSAVTLGIFNACAVRAAPPPPSPSSRPPSPRRPSPFCIACAPSS